MARRHGPALAVPNITVFDVELREALQAIESSLIAIDAKAGQGGTTPPPTSGQAYVHSQGTPAAVWTINHNLGFRPNVRVEDSSGTDCEGDVAYAGANDLTITFSAAFSGTAYLS